MGTHRNEEDRTEVSKAEVDLMILRRCEQCPRDGQLQAIKEDVKKIEANMSDVMQTLARQEGAAQEAAKAAGLRAGLYGAAITAVISLVLFFANRMWPAQQVQAAPIVHQIQPSGGPTP